ncbi:raffinose/stachyose/melibiose transport system permease protein [Paenibacillus sp. yr247]|uniref:carbohydrate ABC transporter permease n=1 Tax=Paenibacillus sp. yr247 TaxID=1761880 RepID=UPI00088852FC|nr:sugar ABC transporter permease [Paenibacillus sp. yr247]SDN52342.1 raffinose/stachyose/melibiose transport system permease protein [Paenibacillus sp. yr247]
MRMIRYFNLNLHKVMAVPAILLFALFFIYPLTQGIGISLTDSNGVTQPSFTGLQNFVDFFHDDRAMHDVMTTVLFALGSAPLLNLFGFLYALLLDRNFKGKAVVRAIVYLPAVISPLIMGYVWYFILQPGRGYLFRLLDHFHPGMWSINWLGDNSAALKVLIFVNVWQFVGMTMIIYLAGLQSIPEELYEASKIDGAGYFSKLWYVTIPMLYPSIKINVVTNIIGSLSVFEIIVALTDGGPGFSTESLSIFILRKLYGSFTGYSTAVALILFLLIIVPVVVFLRLVRHKEFEL